MGIGREEKGKWRKGRRNRKKDRERKKKNKNRKKGRDREGGIRRKIKKTMEG